MANVLTSFLIGIGFDTSKIDAGVRGVESGMDRVKGSVLKTSAGIVGAFGAGAASVVSTAREVDQLALKTNNLRTSQQYIYNYGNALKSLGGNAEDALSQVSSIETALNNLRLKGEMGPLQDLALAGIDISQLQYAQSGEDFLLKLSEQFPRLDKGQRGVAKEALGLDDASVKLLSMGPEAFQGRMMDAEGLTGNLNGLTENSRILMENSAKFGQIIDGVTNEMAEKFLPSLIGVSSWANEFLLKNRDKISNAIDYAAENSNATFTLGTSAGASLAGAGLAKLGLQTAGTALGKAGAAGMAVSSSAIGADVLNEVLGKYVPHYIEASQSFDRGIMKMTGWDHVPSPMEVFFGQEPQKPAPGTAGAGRPMDSGVASDPEVEVEQPVWMPVDRSGVGPNDPRSEVYNGPVIKEQVMPDADLAPQAINRVEQPVPIGAEQAAREGTRLEAMQEALRRPVEVNNKLTVVLDGQALEAKIIETNERVAYDALADIQTTTAR